MTPEEIAVLSGFVALTGLITWLIVYRVRAFLKVIRDRPKNASGRGPIWTPEDIERQLKEIDSL